MLSWFLSTIREQVNNKSHQEFLYFNLLDTLLCLDAMRITYNLGQLPIPKFTYWVMLVVEEMFHIQVMRGTGQHLPELILYTRANTQESLWEDGPHVSSMVEHWRHNARDGFGSHLRQVAFSPSFISIFLMVSMVSTWKSHQLLDVPLRARHC